MSVPMRREYEATPVVPEAAPPPLRRRKPRRRARRLLAALALVGCLATGGLVLVGVRSALAGTGATPALSLAPATPAGGSVVLGGARAERHFGFVSVVGSVTNHTALPLSKIEAVVELLDASNRTVQVESALAAFDPLAAGESAPFRVELVDAPQAVSFRVRFKQLLGPRLD